MRHLFCRALVQHAQRPDWVFLTGDLGFGALEPLRDALGSRFVNAGVAEQNMVAASAGLSKSGLRPWLYSIAPFLYARALEQIRNDLALPNLPAVLVGNGGGYGYGVMGSTHHALEDYGVLLTLPNLHVLIPAFDGDVASCVAALMDTTGPAFLRLGLSEQPGWLEPAPFAPWRRLFSTASGGPTVAIAGPLAGGIVEAVRSSDVEADVWLVSRLPLEAPPPEFLESTRRSGTLIAIEEHTLHGGFGQMLAHQLIRNGQAPARFVHRYALGYPSGRYGSQRFHRRESGLDPQAVLRLIREGSRS
jgi:transketolase